MDPQSFARITTNSQYAAFAKPLSVLESRNLNDFTLPGQAERALPLTELQPQQDIESMVRNIDRLPAMPNMARRLLRLRNDAHATIRDLTDIIQGDPSLTAQIVRYARSAFFNYQGKVETLEHAIGRVLGFETVLNMALGLAASRTFHNPADGPLGLQAFWRHATFSAALAQSLATRIKTHLPINPGIAYLAGLLHNFGFLLAGHLCRAEFFLLNKVVAANPHIPVRLIERRILGVDHTEMGGWLMEAWDMPAAITTSVREHHNELYDGEHALYAQLVFLVDQLLRAHNIGEGLDGEPSSMVLNALGLDRATAEEMTLRVLESSDALDSLARQLAAA
jgi:HD-like signal output (HDOD) protein